MEGLEGGRRVGEGLSPLDAAEVSGGGGFAPHPCGPPDIVVKTTKWWMLLYNTTNAYSSSATRMYSVRHRRRSENKMSFAAGLRSESFPNYYSIRPTKRVFQKSSVASPRYFGGTQCPGHHLKANAAPAGGRCGINPLMVPKFKIFNRFKLRKSVYFQQDISFSCQ